MNIFELSPPQSDEKWPSFFVMADKNCASSVSDRFEMTSFLLDQPSIKGIHDVLTIALSQNCNIKLLLPKWSEDTFTWPFSLGMDLIRSCNDAQCNGHSASEYRPRISMKYKRLIISP